MSQEQMSQEDFAIVKLAAAQRYKERNIHPDTASYLFDRKMNKLAAGCDKPAAKAKVVAKARQPAAKAEVKAAAPAADKITKLAGALKNVLPPKQATVKAAKAKKLSESLKKLVNG